MLLIPSNVNLFIGNLDYSVREAQLEELFSECGEVSSCKVVIDKMTDRSRGFAFVEMAKAFYRTIVGIDEFVPFV